MVTFDLGDELTQIQSTVQQFAVKQLRPKLRAIEKSGPSDSLRADFAELGLTGVEWPEAAGGQAMGTLVRVLIEEELAAGDVGASFALDAPGAASQLLLAINTPAAHAVLKGLLQSGGRAALAAAEEGKAQDDFRTTAARTATGWSLTGKKAWVFHGGDAAVHRCGPRLGPPVEAPAKVRRQHWGRRSWPVWFLSRVRPDRCDSASRSGSSPSSP